MNAINLNHIARLARLRLSDPELAFLSAQVPQVLKFVEKLNEVNVDGIEPTSHPLPLKDVFRQDRPQAPLAIENFLKTAPKARGRFFEVPKVIEDKS